MPLISEANRSFDLVTSLFEIVKSDIALAKCSVLAFCSLITSGPAHRFPEIEVLHP